MAQGQFNVLAFARRLGLKNVTTFPVIETVQPVALVSQQGQLNSQLEPPSGGSGGTFGPVPAERSSMELEARAPGGVQIKSVNGGFAQTILWAVLPGPISPLSGTFFAVPVFQTSTEVPASIVRGGTKAVSDLPAPGAAVYLGGATQLLDTFVPRGFRLVLEANALNIATTFSLLFREVPVTGEEAPG